MHETMTLCTVTAVLWIVVVFSYNIGLLPHNVLRRSI